MDKTLFYQRENFTVYGHSELPNRDPQFPYYEDWWWTFPGANDPVAPDTQPDPMADVRQGDGTIPKYFTLGKISQTLMTQAKRKRNLISVLGADWTIDANEKLTGDAGATYEGVTFTEEYAFMRDMKSNGDGDRLSMRRSWRRQLSELVNKLSGKTWKISPDDDRWFYRTGRVEVTDPSQTGGHIAITADCDPWKYEKYSTIDLWEWDDFDFEYGIIREREDYDFNLAGGVTQAVVIPPRDKPEHVYIQHDGTGALALFWGSAETFIDTPENERQPISGNTGSEFVKTNFVPTPEKHLLRITNPGTAETHIRVYYRGAMR